MSYAGKATRTGNSRAFRFESALFTSHPEFAEGDMEADVIAPGRLLVRKRSHGEKEDEDPVLSAYLAFLQKQMVANPGLMRPLTEEDVVGLDDLLAGVEYDKEETLDEGFDLP